MFVNNKYLTWYINIIAQAQSRNLGPGIYSEKHHIIPKSLGGTNEPQNLVVLTGREHFLVHKMLTKFTTGSHHHKMTHALWRMLGPKDKRDRYRVSASEYEKIKSANMKSLSESRKGKISPAQIAANIRRRGRPAHNKGKPISEEQKQKMRDTAIQRAEVIPRGSRLKLTAEQREKRINCLKRYHGAIKGTKCPKYRYVIFNCITSTQVETTHLKNWLKDNNISEPKFYAGNSGWTIIEKYRLRTGQRLL